MSFPRYPKYKDSGVEWLGEVPEHWTKTALKFLADYQNGFPFKPEDWGTEGLPIIRIAQLTGDGEPNYFAGTLDKRVLVGTGDLLFSWSANIDSFIWAKGPAWLNQHIFKVTPSAEADPTFLFYVIKHVAPKLADFDAHGSTMRHIKKESLGERVFVPPPAEQTQIADFLDRETAKIDELVAEQQRLMELLKEKRQAVISHAVTQGLNLHAPMKSSGTEWLGDVPAHWKVRKLKHACHVFPSNVDKKSHDGETPVQLCNYTDVYYNDTITAGMEFMAATASSDQIAKFTLHAGDTIITKDSETADDIAIGAYVPNDLPGVVCGYHLSMVRPLPDTDGAFVKRLFDSIYAKSCFAVRANGLTRVGLGQYELDNVELPFPPLSEQTQIAAFLDRETAKFDTLAAEAQRATDLLQERRTALISAAVTGQIDVRDFATVANP